jgi:low affinity Fe/Cu permease
MESTYTKISRNGFWLRLLPGVRHDLYLGPDHLLLVEQVVFAERYKRFYYTDIQYISVAKSGRSVGFTISFTILLICGLPFFLGWQYPVLLGIAIALTVMFGSLLIYNLMLGPSCLVQIKTETQLRRIPPLERLPTYEKRLVEIQKRILAAQLPQSQESHAV